MKISSLPYFFSLFKETTKEEKREDKCRPSFQSLQSEDMRRPSVTAYQLEAMIIHRMAKMNLLSHSNAILAPQARQARPSGAIRNYSLSRSLISESKIIACITLV